MRRLILAITGASGAVLGIRALEMLAPLGEVETHLILSPAAARTIREETDYALSDVLKLADCTYSHRDIGAALASGSFRTAGMLVAPCSIKTLSGIAHSYSADLVTRAADVCLKERRRLVLLVRETPLHLGHIALMDLATRSGAIVMPPVPAFYTRPRTLAETVSQTVGRALELLDIEVPGLARWKDPQGSKDPAGPADDGSLWSFSLRFYGSSADVPRLLLALQDHGALVNVCLYLLYLAAKRLALGPAQAECLHAAATPWQAAVLRPLREVRQRLKGEIGAAAPPETREYREQIKGAELEAERLEQSLLERAVPAEAALAASSAEAAARSSLQAYAGVLPGVGADAFEPLLPLFERFLVSNGPASDGPASGRGAGPSQAGG